MPVKTELCAFSEMRVYPGHGCRFVTRTGAVVFLSGSKVTSLYHQRKKPAKLYWTIASRRVHKKLNVEAGTKKRARRVVKVQRGYVGAANVTDIKKSNARPAGAAAAPRTKVVHAAVAEAKAKAKAAQTHKKSINEPKAKPAAGHQGGKGR